RGGEVGVEDGDDALGEPGERLPEQVLEAGEVVGHRTQRDTGTCGDPAVRGAGDALVGDEVEGGRDDALAALRVGVSGGHGNGLSERFGTAAQWRRVRSTPASSRASRPANGTTSRPARRLAASATIPTTGGDSTNPRRMSQETIVRP